MGPGNKPLDMEWLEDFVTLANTRNFSRAAEARAIAQPALSRHIKALEEWVGVELVDRSSHPTELTAAGQRFLPQLQEVLSSLEAARIKARLAHDESAASLRFAVTHVLSQQFFPGWLAQVERTLPLGPVQTLTDSFQACCELMLQRRVQFVLCYGHGGAPNALDEADYPMVVLGADQLLPVAAANAQGAPVVHLDTLGPLPVLGYSEASGLGRLVQLSLNRLRRRADRAARAAASANGAMPSVVFTAHSATLLKSMALAGRGLAWLPRSLISDELARSQLVPAGGEAWNHPLEVRLYRQHWELAAGAEALWREVRGI